MPSKADYVREHGLPRKSINHASNYPRITNVQGSKTGLITWTTDVASSSQVLFGVVPFLGFITAYDATPVTSHSVQIPITLPGTYYFRVQSFNIDALSISDLYTLTTDSLLMEDGTYIVMEDGTRISLE